MARGSRAISIVDRGSREHYDDAELYDFEYRRRRRDVHFYRELAQETCGGPGEVLEMCCGSGRLTAALARDGHRVFGFDLSPAMLVRARRRIWHVSRAARTRVSLFGGDMRQLSLGRRFRLIVMAFNSFEHLYTRVEVAACLDVVRRHLEPGGCFAFDVQMPDLTWLLRDPERHWARTRFRHPTSRQKLEYSTNHDYDPVNQIALIRLYYKPLEPGPLEHTRVVHLSQRKFFPAELETLLHGEGFAIARRYGDFDREPLSDAAESQVVVARPRAVSGAR